MKSLLSINGPTPQALKASVNAIIAVIKAGGTEATSVAGLNALIALAKAPEHLTITNCSFIGEQTKRKPAKRKA